MSKQTRTDHHPSVAALLAAYGTSNAELAIRSRARALLEEVAAFTGFEGPPFDVVALASYRGFKVRYSDAFSSTQDACVLPGAIVLNRRKPRRRQRYSIAHEIIHTLFPDYEEEIRSAGALWRDEAAQVEEGSGAAELEHLCQVGASELLLPQFAFEPQLTSTGLSLHSVIRLSSIFDASVEATVRRAVEITTTASCAVFYLPHDRNSGRPIAQGYTPYAELRVSRAYGNSGAAAILPLRGTAPPQTSVVYKAWKRAPHLRLAADTYEAREEWPLTSSAARETLEIRCDAMSLPRRDKEPTEVLTLLRTA